MNLLKQTIQRMKQKKPNTSNRRRKPQNKRNDNTKPDKNTGSLSDTDSKELQTGLAGLIKALNKKTKKAGGDILDV